MTRIGQLGSLLTKSGSFSHGVELVLAVVFSYGISLLFGLVEPLWAVMGALVVLRPSRASTLDAGRARILGTLLGAASGVIGAALVQFGAPFALAGLGLVAILAFASAGKPALRAAPVAALIVVSASSSSAHSALEIAFVRVAQIFIGVGVGFLVASVSSRVRPIDTLNRGCARILRGTAQKLNRRTGEEALAAARSSDAVRRGLERLSLLALSADRAPRWPWSARATPEKGFHQKLVGLTACVVEDLNQFARLKPFFAGTAGAGDWQVAADEFTARLTALANEMEGGLPDGATTAARTGPTTQAIAPDVAKSDPTKLLAGSLLLLAGDLEALQASVRVTRETPV
ncbi:MAG: FUSC family protein [Burkholderiaceae bacterium]